MYNALNLDDLIVILSNSLRYEELQFELEHLGYV